MSQTEDLELLDTSSVSWVGILFIILGIGAFIFLISLVTGDSDFQATFEGNLIYSASNLPDGLEINPETGLITGQLEAEPGVYRVNVDVQRENADEFEEFPFVTFNWRIVDEDAQDDITGSATPPQSVNLSNVDLSSPGDQANVAGEQVLLQIEATDELQADAGAIVLAFLQNFGIVIPAIIIGVGAYLIRMGVLIYQRSMVTALWARQLLMWLAIAGGVGIIFGLLNGGDSAGGIILSTAPWVFLEAVVLFLWGWFNNNLHLFKGQETISSRQARIAWNLLVPTILILIVVALQPLEQTFIASLTDERFASEEEINFVGLDNYTELLGLRIDTFPCADDPSARGCTRENGDLNSPRRYFTSEIEQYDEWDYRPLSEFSILGTDYVLSARDTDFIDSISNTMVFTVLSVSIELVLGLFIAMVVNSKFAGRGLMRTAMLIPWAIPTVVSARLWEVILRDNQSGILNQALISTGLIDTSQSWLTNPDLQILSMVFVDVWKTTPFMALLLLAGLQTIPSDVYEAADVDGASKVRQFFSITIPLLRPAIAVALVFRTLDAVRVFDVFQVLLAGNRFSMATYNYEVLIQRQEFGYASAVGVVIFIIILVFTIGYVRLLGVQSD